MSITSGEHTPKSARPSLPSPRLSADTAQAGGFPHPPEAQIYAESRGVVLDCGPGQPARGCPPLNAPSMPSSPARQHTCSHRHTSVPTHAPSYLHTKPTCVPSTPAPKHTEPSPARAAGGLQPAQGGRCWPTPRRSHRSFFSCSGSETESPAATGSFPPRHFFLNPLPI